MGDIPLLVDYFLDKISAREQVEKKHVSPPDVMTCLENYNWPGNIRELENTLIRAVTLSIGSIVEMDVLPKSITKAQKLNGLIRLVEAKLCQ